MKHEAPAVFIHGEPLVQRESLSVLDRVVSARFLLALLTTLLAADQLLLWRFLGVMPWWAYLVGAALGGCLAWAVFASDRAPAGGDRAAGAQVTVGVLLASLAVALAVLLLGGEGRVFYANVDWQIRDAVLRDMGMNPWPFAYTGRGAPDLLRAPLGMYLLPALAFKAWGPVAADLALLAQNAGLLTIILALGSTLFGSPRAKAVALLVFLAFSGLDVIGVQLMGVAYEHMEGWDGVQFSSTLTLAFWAPQHALAGWLSAVMFLLWREGRMRLVVPLALLPLTALWSPLALMGSLVFAGFAGVDTLRRRRLTGADVVFPALACVLVVPGLVYLGAAGDAVGLRLYRMPLPDYLLFEALETLPYIVPLLYAATRSRTDVPVLIAVIAILLVAPLIQIGWSVDFAMRASIPALAILAVLVARLLLRPAEPDDRLMHKLVVLALCVGATVGASEIRRALAYPASPRGHCTLPGAFDHGFAPGPKDTYLAPLARVPAFIRPVNPTLLRPDEATSCWSRPWHHPTGV